MQSVCFLWLPAAYWFDVGFSCHKAGAIVYAKKAIEIELNDLVANVMLTPSLGLAGRIEEARTATKEILRLNPKFSVAGWQERSFQKDRAVVKQYCDALRKAGLPE